LSDRRYQPQLFVFKRLRQFCDAQFQALDFAFDAVPADHLPRENLHQPDSIRSQDKEGRTQEYSTNTQRSTIFVIEFLTLSVSVPDALPD
jgi:hypothetical protein